MHTECTEVQLEFQGAGRRRIEGAFDGGHLGSDGGALLLRETDLRLGLTRRLAECFTDLRRQDLIEHSVLELVRQRVYGLALGYEDLNDHDDLMRDPLLALSVGRDDPAKLRTADKDASDGAMELLAFLAQRIRARWPEVRIVVRADSGFCRDELMNWCENNEVKYVLGLAKNVRLLKQIANELVQARDQYQQTRQAARVFTEFLWTTRESWSRKRRVIAKAEHLEKSANPRFIVTNLTEDYAGPRPLYEELYCARGEAENRIKEQQLDLFADRTSTHTFRANQLRLWFSSLGYALVCAMRRTARHRTRPSHLRHHPQQTAQDRRAHPHHGTPHPHPLRQACPYQEIFRHALASLTRIPLRR